MAIKWNNFIRQGVNKINWKTDKVLIATDYIDYIIMYAYTSYIAKYNLGLSFQFFSSLVHCLFYGCEVGV